MTLKQVSMALRDLEIDAETISFYKSLTDGGDVQDACDSNFESCDLTGETGSCGTCVARSLDGSHLIEFAVLDTLIGSHVGRLAGAF